MTANRLTLESKNWFLAAAVCLLMAVALQFSSGAALAPTPMGAVDVDVDISRLALASDDVKVIVQKWSHQLNPGTENVIRKLGGNITRRLSIINGFAATIPSGAVSQLHMLPGAKAVTLDRPVQLNEGGNGSDIRSVYTKSVKAEQMWNAGYNGSGVGVALIDTGIADVADLSGRVLPIYDDVLGTYSPCVNLSGESDCADSYGHGTFIAGIIGGNGAASGGEFKGVAPAANLVSIKIAGRDGSADVSKVIAGIQWAVSFKDRYNLRVLNLSLGTNGTQSYRTDPLNYAVEKAWTAGITVVVSASNRGPDAGTIAKPGDDPWVITVGAMDDRGTAGTGDDRLPFFSSRGPTAADGLPKPDVAAPGAHIVSLRAPGSEVDTRFPNYISGAYRKGSGTSMSAGVVSGAAALMHQADPSTTPDRVKFALTATARSAASADPMAVGSGEIDVYGAALQAPAGLANVGLDHSSGMGSLDASRGDVLVQSDDPLSTVVSAYLTAQLLLWDPIAYTTSDWTGSTWYGSTWYGSTWYGSTWYGSTWYGSTWYGSTWYGSTWYGSTWYGQTEGSTWYGSTWYGSTWYGAWA